MFACIIQHCVPKRFHHHHQQQQQSSSHSSSEASSPAFEQEDHILKYPAAIDSSTTQLKVAQVNILRTSTTTPSSPSSSPASSSSSCFPPPPSSSTVLSPEPQSQQRKLDTTAELSPPPRTVEAGQTPSQSATTAGVLLSDSSASSSTLSAFAKWRPAYHFIAPYGWMNDPCAPFFHQHSKLFHIFFQWNPQGPDWGNMSWGHATSPDLIRWTRVNHSVSDPASLQKHAVAPSAPNSTWGPALEPQASYDHLGVFTGCALTRPVVLGDEQDSSENSTITSIYTSVSHLPIHHTLPYTRGAETLSIATSTDAGRSWVRMDHSADGGVVNPILDGPPAHLEVTAWRDPYVATWPAMDTLLGRRKGKFLYGTIAGGLRALPNTTPRDTPTAFLYSIPIHDLRQWDFLGTLFDLGHHARQGSEQGDWGANFEVCNVFAMPLSADALEASWSVGIINVENCLPSSFHVPVPTPRPATEPAEPKDPQAAPNRLPRRAMWTRGSLHSSTGEHGKVIPSMKPEIGGPLDWGCLYAANTYEDFGAGPAARRIMWGWIPDDDLASPHTAAQGWQGCLALPRLLSIQETRATAPAGVSLDAYVELLRSYGNFDVTLGDSVVDNGCFVVRTLGIEPVPEALGLRRDIAPVEKSFTLQPVGSESASSLPPVLANVTSLSRSALAVTTLGVSSRTWEAELTIDLNAFQNTSSAAGQVGLVLAHSADLSQSAALVYDLASSTLVVHRELSSPHANINKTAVDGGPLRLLHLPSSSSSKPGPSGSSLLEPLRLRVFLDNSVLEVYANGRWACSSRIYPDSIAASSGGSATAAAAAAVGLSVFAMRAAGSAQDPVEIEGAHVKVESRVWERLRPAFEDEP
ncbi:hypothetical protein V8E36_009885 [Tilletia maclaganii]